VWGLRDGTPPNKKKKYLPNKKKYLPNKKTAFQARKTPFEQGETAFQTTRKTPFEQWKRLSNKGYIPIKCKSLQVVGVSRQGKAVVSDGG
jgi:hypothetical protein